MKEAYYFSHDSNAANDSKMLILLAQLGLEGYGIYWTIIEHLREQPNYVSQIKSLEGLAMRFGTSREKYETVVKAYGLFMIKDDLIFWSESLTRRMLQMENIRQKKIYAGKKSGEARKLIARQLTIESNTCSTNKIKENKIKEKDIYNVDLSKRVLSCLFEKKKEYIKGCKPFTLTESRRRLIKKRVTEGNGYKQFEAVIDYKVREWQNTDLQKYLVPETLFSEKFTKYLDQARDEYTQGKNDNPYK